MTKKYLEETASYWDVWSYFIFPLFMSANSLLLDKLDFFGLMKLVVVHLLFPIEEREKPIMKCFNLWIMLRIYLVGFIFHF